MRSLVLALLLTLAAFVAGVLFTKTAAPMAASVPAAGGTLDDAALADLRKDNQMLRAQIAALAGEISGLRASLPEHPVAIVNPAAAPVPGDQPDPAAAKPARDALERFRAATGNQRPAAPADLVPFFTDPQDAEKYLRNREAATSAKPARQQLKAEVKQRLKAGAAPTPAP